MPNEDSTTPDDLPHWHIGLSHPDEDFWSPWCVPGAERFGDRSASSLVLSHRRGLSVAGVLTMTRALRLTPEAIEDVLAAIGPASMGSGVLLSAFVEEYAPGCEITIAPVGR